MEHSLVGHVANTHHVMPSTVVDHTRNAAIVRTPELKPTTGSQRKNEIPLVPAVVLLGNRSIAFRGLNPGRYGQIAGKGQSWSGVCADEAVSYEHRRAPVEGT